MRCPGGCWTQGILGPLFEYLLALLPVVGGSLFLLPALNQRCDGEIEARETEDRIINERIDKEISDREQA